MANVQNTRAQKMALVVCNLLLAVIAVAAAVVYAHNIRQGQKAARQADFISTVESMKSVSQNYLDSERGYLENWAAYIDDQKMDRAQALEFLRKCNTNPNRYVHIVDMDTMDAWSAYYPVGSEEIDTYKKYKDTQVEWEKLQADNMWAMFNGTAAPFTVLGRYQLQETLAPAIAVGTRITLRVEDGTKDYLLLRAIPAESIRKTWVFPAEYQTAEVGIMTRSGDYVIQSASMKSISFPEYIRAYNFENDYNQGEALRKQLESNPSGTLTYKNYRGTECLWYYSSFADDSDLYILGMLNASELESDNNAWFIVALICGTLLLLILVDGFYLYQVNQRLRRTAKLAEQASQAKTQFLSAMSHDIRTPMNAVLGMTAIAQRNVNDPAYVSQCLEKSMSAGKQLLTIINDVLDISKIESGQFVFTPAEVRVPQMLRELVDMVEPQCREKELHFTQELGELPHPVVMADPIRLNQIYMNLLSNAVKYTQPGGSVTLKLYEVPLSGQEDHTRLVFHVADNGIGMTPEFQQKMYQSFARAINTQVNHTQGTGLGLAIVRQMVDRMGGIIDCTSEVGKGTAFTVQLDLPIAAQEVCKAPEAEPGTDDVSGLRLLVAEDNELNWEIAEVLLNGYGVECQRAENGRRCLEQLVEAPAGRFDGILMDIQMPEMNGLEAARQIRALPDPEKSCIPIIAMTADAFAEDVQTCMDSGMNGHIAKPIDGTTLQSYLRKIKNKTL